MSLMNRQTPFMNAIYIGIAGLFLLRLWLANQFPLIADEAHYALYALNIDWSYFDHPPMVGWLQWLPLQFAQEDWLVRLVPNLLHSLIAIQLVHLSQTISNRPNIGWITFLIFETSPLLQLIGLGLIPDLPLIFFTLMMMQTILKLHQQRHLGHLTSRDNFSQSRSTDISLWIVFGISLGGMGLSKYPAIVLAFGLGLWILRFHLNWLIRWQFWLSMVIGLVLILPVVYWNQQHQWISLSYQLAHGRASDSNLQFMPFGQAQLSHLLTYGLLIGVISFGLWRYLLYTFFEYRPVVSLFAFVALPIWVVFAITSAKGGHYLPHWIAVFAVLSIPYIAHVIAEIWHHAIIFTQLIFAKCLIWALGLLTLMLPLGAYLTYQSEWQPSANRLFIKQFTGWQQASKKAQQLSNQLTESKVIFVPNWSEASRVAWYAYPNPVQAIDQRFDQFDLWYGSFGSKSDGILLSHRDHPKLNDHLNAFATCQAIDTADELKFSIHTKQSSKHISFGLWYCLNPQ